MQTPQKRPWRIAVIPGDGIGQEIVPQGLRVIEAEAGTRSVGTCSASTLVGFSRARPPSQSREILKWLYETLMAQ